MEVNNDVNTVVLDLKLYNKLLEMSGYAVHEDHGYELTVRQITKHVRRFNPHTAVEHNATKELDEADQRATRARLKALFKAGGKQIYFRESEDLFWPVKLTQCMKHDWRFIGMRSSTEHRKFTSYEIWQPLDNFFIATEIPVQSHPTIPGAFVRRLTQAQRDAEHIATMKHCFAPKPYQIQVTLKGSSLNVCKVDLQGSPFEMKDQEEVKHYLSEIKCLMHDLVDERFVGQLEKIAYETFIRDRYYKGLIIHHTKGF